LGADLKSPNRNLNIVAKPISPVRKKKRGLASSHIIAPVGGCHIPDTLRRIPTHLAAMRWMADCAVGELKATPGGKWLPAQFLSTDNQTQNNCSAFEKIHCTSRS
jgi:hypothetical protein